MKTRLRAAHIPATIALLRGNRIEVSLQRRDAQILALLEQPGRVVFRITPNGPSYGHPRIVAAKADHYNDDPADPAVDFELADGTRFHKFTEAHLNEYLGIYLDGKLLDDPRIVAPLDNEVYIVGGKLSEQKARWIASLLAGGPLPARVRLVKG